MALGFHTEGRPEDGTAQRCAVTVGSRIRAASRLTRVGRQTVGPVRSKDVWTRYCCGDQGGCQN
jgi:hypothetical protein